MKYALWIALFLSGALLALCTRQNSPLLAAAPAGETPSAVRWSAAEDDLCLVREGDALVLYVAGPDARREIWVCRGSDGSETGSRTVRLGETDRSVTVRTAQGRLFAAWEEI